jgi:RNA polymerase sigma factor (sigma-70 family)
MKEWHKLVVKAKEGDIGAFDSLIRAFRDMAVGYAYSILGDFPLAEDAAQEAFVQVFKDLETLREPKAFPSWFRRIVFKHCDRITRKKARDFNTFDIEPPSPSKEDEPQAILQKKETIHMVLSSINLLPTHERSVTNLFYINGYSMNQIGDFLEVPAKTVKSRLYSARKKLRKRMVDMVKETLTTYAPGEAFNKRVRRILAEVPKVSFELHQTKKKDGLKRCPESVPFPSCVRAYLEFIGEDLGFKRINVYNKDWRLDTTYVILMGVTGSAFRLIWKPGWFYDNPLISHMSKDPLEPYCRGLDSLDYRYEIIKKGPNQDQEELFRSRIVTSISDYGRPVIAQGVVGPPEECLITGFDEKGQVLIGWSFFQRIKEFAQKDVEFEKGGYFRKRNWYDDTHGLIFIGDKKASSPLDKVYLKSLNWALKIMDSPMVRGRYIGLAAYKAWAEAILNDEEFTNKGIRELRLRYNVHHDAVGSMAEGRWYAYQFLKKVDEDVQAPEVLSKAAICFDNQHSLMWNIWGLVGGPGMSDKKARLFANPQVRKEAAEYILQAKEENQKAFNYIKEAIRKW